MRKNVLLSFLGIILIFAPFTLYASDDPTLTGEIGIFSIMSANTVEKGKFSLGASYNNIDRETLDADIAYFTATLGYGLTDKLEVVAAYNFHQRADIDGIFDPQWSDTVLNTNPKASDPWIEGAGDVQIGAKYRFVAESESRPALAARAFFKIPTADDDKGLGTGELDFGADLIATKNLAKLVDVSANVGFTLIGSPDNIRGTSGDLSNELRWGIGGKFPSEKFLQGVLEVIGINYISDDDFPQEDPIDLIAGLQIKPASGIRVGMGYRRNLTFDSSNNRRPDGAVFLLSYTHKPAPSVSKPAAKEPEPEVAAKEKAVEPTKQPEPEEAKFEDLYFDFDKYDLRPKSIEKLDYVAEVLNVNPEMTVELEGHCCSIGTDEYNLMLGDQRAQSVKKYLVEKKGIDPSRVNTISYGESRPIFDNSREETRQYNRRVHIRILKK